MVYDALVIGGGPSGATAALLLARAGWNVALAEKSPFPRSKVCGEFSSATSLPLLREIGLDEEFRAAAGPAVRRIGIFAQDAMLTEEMPRMHPFSEWGRALGSEHLDLMLLSAAAQAGATVRQPCKVIELRRERKRFVCTLAGARSTEQLVAQFVIAANGSWQPAPYPIRRRPHRRSDLLAFKAHFRGSELPADLMPLFAFPGGYGGMVHSDNGRVSLSWEPARARRRGDRITTFCLQRRMSAFGTKRTLPRCRTMSAFGGKADINERQSNVCF